METRGIRILLVHKQTILREGLAKVLSKQPGLEVVAAAADGEDALKLVTEAKPDVLLLDSSIPVHPVMDAFRQLGPSANGSQVLVLAKTQETSSISDVFRMGARGVVMREASTEILIKAIRCLKENMYWNVDHGAGNLETTLEELAKPTAKTPLKKFGLTPREIEIVSAIVSGYSNRQIAEKMSISQSTIKHHLTNIFDKLGVYNRLELALFAIHHALAERENKYA
jgi:two-component system, NarL family, nitrate/nitrite response regulator NarL